MGAGPNHYRTLGLEPGAGADQVKSRFRQLALVHHPDHNGGNPEAEARFLLILHAWKVLGDPGAKEEYDRYLAGRSVPASPPGPRAPKRPKTTGAEVGESLNSLLWDIEDLVRRGGPLSFQRDLMRVLTFLDQWVLGPAGFVDYFMEARGLERLNPSAYIDFICAAPGRLTHFPFTSVANYFYDIRKRTNAYLGKVNRIPWIDPIPGKSVRYIDAFLETQSLAIHYLTGLRRVPSGDAEVPRYVPSHPDFS